MIAVNPKFEPKMYAIPGTTAQQWISAPGLLILQKIFTENKNLTHMWISLGGNGKQKKI
jgi:hypothetical protein